MEEFCLLLPEKLFLKRFGARVQVLKATRSGPGLPIREAHGTPRTRPGPAWTSDQLTAHLLVPRQQVLLCANKPKSSEQHKLRNKLEVYYLERASKQAVRLVCRATAYYPDQSFELLNHFGNRVSHGGQASILRATIMA
jgi:hypothetical protein